MKRLDLINQRFGRLVVVSEGTKRGKKRTYVCACDCGKESTAFVSDLTSGKHTSCGCFHREIVTKHGHAGKHGRPATRTRAYKCWTSMKIRSKWGESLVDICKEWNDSFQAFLRDMGDAPTERHSLDRYPDRCGQYKPGNVRWATPREQVENRSCARMLTYLGKTKNVSVWCRELGLNESTIRYRVRAGWSDHKILTTPIRIKR